MAKWSTSTALKAINNARADIAKRKEEDGESFTYEPWAVPDEETQANQAEEINRRYTELQQNGASDAILAARQSVADSNAAYKNMVEENQRQREQEQTMLQNALTVGSLDSYKAYKNASTDQQTALANIYTAQNQTLTGYDRFAGNKTGTYSATKLADQFKSDYGVSDDDYNTLMDGYNTYRQAKSKQATDAYSSLTDSQKTLLDEISESQSSKQGSAVYRAQSKINQLKQETGVDDDTVNNWQSLRTDEKNTRVSASKASQISSDEINKLDREARAAIDDYMKGYQQSQTAAGTGSLFENIKGQLTNPLKQSKAISEGGQLMESARQRLKELGYSDSDIKKYEEYAQVYAEDNLMEKDKSNAQKHPLSSNANAILTDATLGMANGITQFTNDTIENAIGKGTNSSPNNFGVGHGVGARASRYASNVQEGTQKAINNGNDESSTLVQKIGKELYNMGYSAAQSNLTNIVGALGSAALGSNIAGELASLAPAFGNTYYQSKMNAEERGLSNDKAYQTAFAEARHEVETETLSDRVLGLMFKEDSIKNILKETLKGAAEEGGEEVTNNILNAITDRVINGDKSELNQTVQNYMAQGATQQEAIIQTATDFIKDSAYDFLTAAGSTIIGMAPNAAARTIDNRVTGNSLFGSNTAQDYRDLQESYDLDESKASYPQVKKAYDLAGKYAEKLENGGKVTTSERAKLWDITNGIAGIEQTAAENAERDEKRTKLKNDIKDGFKGIFNRSENTTQTETTTAEQTPTTENQTETTGSAQGSVSGAGNYVPAETHTTYNDAYKAIQSATTQEELNDAVQDAKASTEISEEDYARLRETAGSYAASKNNLNMEVAEVSTEDAYNEGYQNPNAENPYTGISSKNAIAFNEAQRRSKEDQEARKAQNKATVEERAKLQLNSVASDFMSSHYNEEIDPVVYSDVIESALTAGRTAADINETALSNPGVALVGEDLVRQAYATGAEVAAKEMIYEEKNSAAMTKGVTFGTGTFSDKRQDKSTTIGGLETLEVLAKVTGLDIELTDDENVVKDGENGHYAPSNSTVYLNAEQAHRLAGTSHHEAFGEFAATWNQKEYASTVNSILTAAQKHYGAAKYNAIRNRYAAAYKAVEKTKTDIDLDKEMANDLLYKFFESKEGMQELMDEIDRQNGVKEAKSIKEKLAEWLKNLADAIRDFMSTFTPNEFQRGIAEANIEHIESLRKEVMQTVAGAIRNYNEAKAQAQNNAPATVEKTTTKVDAHTEAVIKRRGLDTLAEAANLEFEKEDNLLVLYDLDGNRIKNVTEDYIKNTPLGGVLTSTMRAGYITEKERNNQAKFFAEMLNQLQRTQDIDLVFAVNSTINLQPLPQGKRTAETKNGLVSKNAALVSNAEHQYRKSGDLTTICVKSQPVIDAMSETMMRLNRGLTEHEIIDIIYDETNRAGERVPCPVCYVFSRWVGLGGLFDNIKNMQEKYPIGIDASTLKHDLTELDKRIDATQEKLTGKKTKSKARETLYKELIEQRRPLEQLEQMGKMNGKDYLTVEQKKTLATLNEQIGYLDNYSWLKDVRMKPSYETQGYVPSEVLFNINAGTRFANEYPLAWKYRTTRGPAMGKAATPYADVHLGQFIRGISTSSVPKDLGDLRKDSIIFERIIPKSNAMSNFRAVRGNQLSAAASRMMNAARGRAKVQNLLGGQRLQSTSDFRFEYLLDNTLIFTELQAVGSGVQCYTKVPEAVGIFASANAEVNVSLMPYGVGYETDSEGSPVYDENGNVKLLFSKVTGMDPVDAFRLSAMYDNVQPIIVGTSPTHIEACGKDKRITFIIPYHASGASEGRYISMMKSVGETVASRTDYTAYQTEHEKEDATPQQIAARELRVDILTGKFKDRSLTNAEKEVLRNNNILHQLYQRFYGHDVDGNNAKIENKYLDRADRGTDGYGNEDSNTFGVFLAKDQAEMIMPYEYWNKELTIDDAPINGDIFAEYCESLGLYPRYSGYKAGGKYVEEGDVRRFRDAYWKTLPDRSMYNLDGTYHEQKAINISNMKLDYLDRNNIIKGIETPSVENDRSKTAQIVEKSIARIRVEEAEEKATEENKKRKSLNIDSDDNNLTESQQKYFENSKVRDEDGRLLVMYHGTGADFTEFDRKYIGSHGSFEGYGFNFTPDKSRASGYSNGRILEGYLNVTNPLSDSEITMTTREFANLIAEADPTGDDIIANYAMNTRDYGTPAFVKREAMTTAKLIMESAQSDVDLYSEISAAGGGDNLIDLFKRMGYDGLIHHNENGSIKTVITFESNQFKNVDNQNPTQAADIRRAVGIDEFDFEQFGDPLLNDLTEDELREWVTTGGEQETETKGTTDLVSALRSSNEVLKGGKVNKADIRKIARQIKSQYGSNINVDTLAENLAKIFDYAQSRDYINYEDLATVIAEVAAPVIDGSVNKVGAKEFDSFKNTLKGYAFKLNERQENEVIRAFGSWGAFRKQLPGVKFVRGDSNGVALDSVWDSLCKESGYVLDSMVTSNDMPLVLVDAYNSMRPTYENAFGEDAERATQDAAMEIVSKYYQYAADQEKSELKKEQRQRLIDQSNMLKKQNEETRKKLQQQYKERLEKEVAKLKQEGKPEKVSVQVARLRARNARTVASLRESQKRKEQLRTLNKNAAKLVEWVSNPTDKNHIPKMMQTPVLELVSAMDFVPQTVRAVGGKYSIRLLESRHVNEDGSYSYTWKTITADTVQEAVEAYKKAMNDFGLGSASNRTWQERMQTIQDLYQQNEEDEWFEKSELKQGLDKNLGEQLGDILNNNRGMLSIAELSSDELQTINDVVRNVMHAVNQMNRMYSQPSQKVTDVAHEVMDRAYQQKAKGRRAHGDTMNDLLDLLTLDNATPETFFHGLFGGDETDPITKTMLKAQNQKARDIRQAQEYMSEHMTKDIKDVVKDWMYSKTGDHNTRNFYGMDLTTTQVMSLYELMKRPDAQQHKIGGFMVDETGRKTDGRHKVVHLTDEQIKTITDTLSEEQKRIADAMQYYMAHQCAEQGNETAMQLYGYEKYLDEHYFPMTTDKNTIATKDSNVTTGAVNAIKNSGFTKKITPNANNPLILKDIFTVFSDHVSDMATYHSWAAPLQDILRFYNYNEKTNVDKGGQTFIERRSTKDAFDYFYGKSGQQYMTKLLSSINQMEKSNLVGGKFMERMTGNAKTAAVMGNIRVVVQQPTAFFRAGEMISYKYLNDGLAGKYVKEAAELRDRTSDVFWLKNQGNIDGYITQGMVSTITGVQTFKEGINEWAGKLASKADEITWAAMYRAVYSEQVDKLGKNKVGTEEFENAVNDRFSEIMLRTQVYDGTITRSQFMRSTDWYNKIASAFMAEPTKTYNILLRHLIDLSQADSKTAVATAKKGIAKAAYVLTLTNFANAVAQSLMDAVRNAGDADDDDKNFWERFLEAFGFEALVDDEDDTLLTAAEKFMSGNFMDNMDMLSNIPLVADTWDAVKSGFKSLSGGSTYSSDSDLSMSGINNFFKAAKAIINPSEKMTTYGRFAAVARGFSDMTGIPLYAVQRDVVAAYNTIAKDIMNGLAGMNLPVLRKTSKYTKAQQAKQDVYEGVITDVYENAVNSGDYKEAIENAVEQGSSYKSIKQSLKSNTQDIYVRLLKTDPSEATKMKNRLAQMYAYLDEKTDVRTDKTEAEKLEYHKGEIDKWKADWEEKQAEEQK